MKRRKMKSERRISLLVIAFTIIAAIILAATILGGVPQLAKFAQPAIEVPEAPEQPVEEIQPQPAPMPQPEPQPIPLELPPIQPPQPTPVEICSGNPKPCFSYAELDSCVNLAGCSYVETLTGAYCTDITGPKPCDSYSGQGKCEQVGCSWQTLPVQPGESVF